MSCIYRISRLSQFQKEGILRFLIPPSIYHRFRIDPLSFCDETGQKIVKFFCPPGDRTCLVEIKLKGTDDPLYSIQVSDTSDATQIDWDFFIVNDPDSEKYNTNVDENGQDTLFGWASRVLDEEQKALEAGLFPGQSAKGLGLTHEVIYCLENFCRIFDIKSIRLEALFYHNAITYERFGFSYFSEYKLLKKIHEHFQPDGELYKLLDESTPFRRSEFAQTIGGRSWAIHDGILMDADDEILCEGWASPVMYRMVGKERSMVTFPDPRYW